MTCHKAWTRAIIIRAYMCVTLATLLCYAKHWMNPPSHKGSAFCCVSNLHCHVYIKPRYRKRLQPEQNLLLYSLCIIWIVHATKCSDFFCGSNLHCQLYIKLSNRSCNPFWSKLVDTFTQYHLNPPFCNGSVFFCGSNLHCKVTYSSNWKAFIQCRQNCRYIHVMSYRPPSHKVLSFFLASLISNVR